MAHVEVSEDALREQKRGSVVIKWLRMVRFSHTLFALPFALVGFAMAWVDGGNNIWWRLLWVVLCMVFARSAAMGFNRIVDRKIDALNVRTATREIPAGKISLRAAWIMVVACCVLFVASAGMLNTLALALSPVALAVVLLYSYLKRFTWLCHFGIGLALSLAPVGAYLAMVDHFNAYSILLSAGVMLWVAGFDIIYSLQDIAFDRAHRLHSIPARFGATAALRVAYISSLLSVIPIGIATFRYAPTPMGIGAVGLFFGAVVVQLLSVKKDDLSNINGSFMLSNGVASLLYGVIAILAIVGRSLALAAA